ncbi:unnamed protein product [Rotaria sp. Silwood2]|nr:unnamed protein product [Rotaria sp. Silwood2]CAF4371969.1 unnamed protein product [Rotaria sp. Silwood2]CAF4414986.1 unnamed protein product [Rotaria sp. Silwood2]
MNAHGEKQNIISPLLRRSTHADNDVIDIESSKSYSNHNQSISSLKNTKINQTDIILYDEHENKTMTISFEKINYTIDQTTNIKQWYKWQQIFSCYKQTTKKQILFDLSGIFTPGMNAILGPTGCGKSTLLDILADRKDSHGLTGDVLLSGRSRPAYYKYTVGYVIQDDIMSETLTVRENLMFSANIRLPRSFSARQRIERVNQVIHDLDLHSCINTFIGTDFIRGVSGGEKKRTSIGMELVLSPKVLFLDEPTTGLDASTAQNVMDCLYNLSRQGRTIIFSIHQPRYSIFQLFDTVLFLSAGHTIYFGSPIDILPYFTSQGFKCNEHENPADFVLDTLIEFNGRSSKILQTVYSQSKMHSNVKSLIESVTNENNNEDLSFLKQIVLRSRTMEFYYLSQRTFRNAIRNPLLAASQITISIILALLTGLLFYNMKATVDPGVRNRLGAIFFLSTHQILSTASALESLIKERALFSHEYVGGYYRVSTFFLTKIVFDLIPMRIIPSFIFSIITYPLTGFQRSIVRFFVFLVTIFVSSVYGSAVCFFVAACIPLFAVAITVTILIFSITMVVSGFLVDLESVFSFFRWIKWISAFHYSSNLLTINEFRNLTFCLSNNTRICPLQGEQILTERNIAHDTDWDMWKNLLAIALMALVLFFMAYIQLLRIKKVK